MKCSESLRNHFPLIATGICVTACILSLASAILLTGQFASPQGAWYRKVVLVTDVIKLTPLNAFVISIATFVASQMIILYNQETLFASSSST